MTRPLRILRAAAITLLFLSPLASAQDTLTEKELGTLLKRLAALKDEAGQRKSGRVATAVAAYKNALAGNEATIDLYLQCIEKVRYADQNRPLIEFREWKRTQKDKFGELSFREALRHQLRWLMLGLEVASKELDPTDMAEKAAEIVATITRDARALAPHMAILRENSFGSVFANAYRVSHLAPENWPASPLPIGAVYETAILPRFRHEGNIKRLEAAWTARIEQEAILVTMEAEVDKERGEAKLDRFNTEERPQLVWKMGTDIFKAGGQRQSAAKMLVFLEANLGHRSAVEWAAEMKELLEGAGGLPVAPPTDTSGTETPPAGESAPDNPEPIRPIPVPPPEEPPPPVERRLDPFDSVNQPE